MAFTWVCPDCTTDNYSESTKPADVDCAECGGEFTVM